MGRKTFLKASTLAALALAPVANAGTVIQVTLLNRTDIAVPEQGFDEPSGLTYDAQTGGFWSVSDDTGRLFLLAPDGTLRPDLSPMTKKKNFEGIVALADGRLAVVREGKNDIRLLDRHTGDVLDKRKLSDMKGFAAVEDDFRKDPEGKGLEGITTDPASGDFFVLKEGRPRLMLRVAGDLSAITQVHNLDRAIGFRAEGVSDKKLDVSGIVYDPVRDRFWIVSDKGAQVYLYDAQARRAERARLEHGDGPHAVENAEGVALNPDATRLFVLTDDGKHSVLLTYAIESP